MVAQPAFNPLTTSASELAALLDQGRITSVDIVNVYLDHIEANNARVMALISVAPRAIALARASSLDAERAASKQRSPLHGIPIVIKDNICTSPELGMYTTLGAVALKHAVAPKNAAIVERLLDAGLIVLGKANLTIMCGLQSSAGNKPGYSSVAGQTQSPFLSPFGLDPNDNSMLPHSSPGGSSAGSAVAVGAGFSPISLGTETVGSIVTPANRAGLYALKPAPGSLDTTGVWRLSDSYDSVGPMARTVTDLRLLSALLFGHYGSNHAKHQILKDDAELQAPVRVGFVDPRLWTLPKEACTPVEGATQQMADDYEVAIERLQAHSSPHSKVLYPVEVPRIDKELNYKTDEAPKGMTGYRLIAHSETAGHVEDFLSSLAFPPDETPIKSVQDLIDWNEAHAEEAFSPSLKDQGELHDLIALQKNPLPAKRLADAVAKFKRLGGVEGLDVTFAEQDVDVLVAPADSSFVSIGAAAGYPCCTVPVGRLQYNGRPFGLVAIAKTQTPGFERGEDALLNFMATWERSAAPSRAIASFD